MLTPVATVFVFLGDGSLKMILKHIHLANVLFEHGINNNVDMGGKYVVQ